MSLSYLWTNRERPRLFSRSWIKSWARRIVLAPALAGLFLRCHRLRRAGAGVGELTVISPCTLNGSRRFLRIGPRSSLGRVTLHLLADLTIGSRVVINDGAIFFTGTHELTTPGWEAVLKPIVVEDFAWVASGAMILPGVRVGRGAVVGAGAVVSKDVPAYGIAVGNPAVIIAKKRCPDLDYDPVRLTVFCTAWLGPL